MGTSDCSWEVKFASFAKKYIGNNIKNFRIHYFLRNYIFYVADKTKKANKCLVQL